MDFAFHVAISTVCLAVIIAIANPLKIEEEEEEEECSFTQFIV